MSAKVTCNTCNKSVSCRNLIKCSLCLPMVHLKCNNLNEVDVEIIKSTGSDRFWVCMCCCNNLFPYAATINNHKLHQTLSQSNNHFNDSSDSYSTKTCSTLKAPQNLSNLFTINFLLSKITTLKMLTVSVLTLMKFKVLIIGTIKML